MKRRPHCGYDLRQSEPTEIPIAMNAMPALPWWQDLTPRRIAELADADAVALLPLAAIEQHGEHLPLSTDLDIALGLLEAALPKLRPGLPWCVLPPFAVGCSLEHGGFAGTLALGAPTALASVVEIGACVARAGLRRLVMFTPTVATRRWWTSPRSSCGRRIACWWCAPTPSVFLPRRARCRRRNCATASTAGRWRPR